MFVNPTRSTTARVIVLGCIVLAWFTFSTMALRQDLADGGIEYFDSLRLIFAIGFIALTNHIVRHERRIHTNEHEDYIRLIDVLPTGVAAIGSDSTILYANRLAAHNLGAKAPSDLLGKPFLNLIPTEFQERAAWLIDMLCSNAAAALPSVEGEWNRLDGTRIWVEATVNRITYEGIPALLITFRDITERHLLDDHKRALEVRIATVQRIESLGLFAAGIAHNMKSILATIMGNAELTQLDMLPSQGEAKASIRHIIEATRHAAALCTALRGYTGNHKAEKEETDIGVLVRETVSLMRVILNAKVRIEAHYAPTILLSCIDTTEIRQVLTNILLNATQAIDNTGLISIHTRIVDFSDPTKELSMQPAQYVAVDICDTGCGMPPEVLDHIFDPFYTTKAEGTGLGLAAVRGIIRDHNGTVLVNSVEGTGTNFTVLLPMVQDKERSV